MAWPWNQVVLNDTLPKKGRALPSAGQHVQGVAEWPALRNFSYHSQADASAVYHSINTRKAKASVCHLRNTSTTYD